MTRDLPTGKLPYTRFTDGRPFLGQASTCLQHLQPRAMAATPIFTPVKRLAARLMGLLSWAFESRRADFQPMLQAFGPGCPPTDRIPTPVLTSTFYMAR